MGGCVCVRVRVCVCARASACVCVCVCVRLVAVCPLYKITTRIETTCSANWIKFGVNTSGGWEMVFK